MLTIKAETVPGANLRDFVMPQMLDLARRTGCMVELTGNDTKFWVRPDDTVEELLAAFDRLYVKSSVVASWIKTPVS